MNTLSLRFAGLVVVAVSLCGTAGAEEPAAKDADSRGTKPAKIVVADSGSPEVDELVRGLVSLRPAPLPTGYWNVNREELGMTFFGRYITPEVEAAIEKLKQKGPEIYPALVKHLRDDRYSFSGIYAAWNNRTVGNAVEEVLSDFPHPHGEYKWRDAANGKGAGFPQFLEYLNEIGAERWAAWAASRTKHEIQLVFVDWCLAEETRRGFVDDKQREHILGLYTTARSRLLSDLKGKLPPPIPEAKNTK